MKVIFLDCDGVLNYTFWYYSDLNPGNVDGTDGDIDPKCVERVVRICKETGAKIVLSSDWKLSWPGAKIRLEKAGFPEGLIIDKTPEGWTWGMSKREYLLGDDQDDSNIYHRGREIDMWLAEHEDVTNYAILDDRTDFTDEQQPHFVHVDPYYGLTDDHADIAIMILNHH